MKFGIKDISSYIFCFDYFGEFKLEMFDRITQDSEYGVVNLDDLFATICLCRLCTRKGRYYV